jgi:hypothetical protein
LRLTHQLPNPLNDCPAEVEDVLAQLADPTAAAGDHSAAVDHSSAADRSAVVADRSVVAGRSAEVDHCVEVDRSAVADHDELAPHNVAVDRCAEGDRSEEADRVAQEVRSAAADHFVLEAHNALVDQRAVVADSVVQLARYEDSPDPCGLDRFVQDVLLFVDVLIDRHRELSTVLRPPDEAEWFVQVLLIDHLYSLVAGSHRAVSEPDEQRRRWAAIRYYPDRQFSTPSHSTRAYDVIPHQLKRRGFLQLHPSVYL